MLKALKDIKTAGKKSESKRHFIMLNELNPSFIALAGSRQCRFISLQSGLFEFSLP